MERGIDAMSMDQPRANPFAVNRWETETLHRIWVPPDVTVAAEPKACFISGLRGTGKTVFLNCLDVLAPAKSNYRFLNQRALPRSCIGAYINILSEFTHYFYLLGPLSHAQDEANGAVGTTHPHAFQTYLIFHAISRAFGVTDDCRRAGVLDYSTQQESAFVDSFTRMWRRYFLDGAASEVAPRTLLDCAATMGRVCMGIRVNSMRLYSERVRSLIEAVQPIAFYQNVCALLLEHALLVSAKREYHIKICLDDAHRVLPADQWLINAILAVNSAPIGWNVSFVTGRYDANSTLDATAPLTDHDVNRLDLNYQNDYKGFKRLCSKMYNMRVTEGREEELSAAAADQEYWQILGRPSTAILFGHLLGKTHKDSFRQKISETLPYVAERLQARGIGVSGARQNHGDMRRYLPQAYMFSILFKGDKRLFEHFLEQRTPKQVDNYFRQKNVAALICAANEIGAEVPYAGFNMLVSLADGCVRDFLQILSILYSDAASGAHGRNRTGQRTPRAAIFSPESSGQLGIDEQSPSFIEASRRYVDHLAPAADRAGRVLLNVVMAIGALQKLLQSRDQAKALAMPERGLIEFNFNETTLYPDQAEREQVLRQALAAGQYIGVVRVLKGAIVSSRGLPREDSVTFRLHHLTAPAFNVSARGPIHAVSVPFHAMLEFAEDSAPDPQRWAQRVYDQIGDQKATPVLSATRQAELFESEF